MSEQDTIKTWKSLGGIPLYEDDTDDLFDKIASLCVELENASLSNQDIAEIFDILPYSAGEDYYGITYRVIDLIESFLKIKSDTLDVRLVKKTEWLSDFVFRYPDRLISE